jgi:hypothetical protein
MWPYFAFKNVKLSLSNGLQGVENSGPMYGLKSYIQAMAKLDATAKLTQDRVIGLYPDDIYEFDNFHIKRDPEKKDQEINSGHEKRNNIFAKASPTRPFRTICPINFDTCNVDKYIAPKTRIEIGNLGKFSTNFELIFFFL